MGLSCKSIEKFLIGDFMLKFLYVGLGGALGAVLRYSFSFLPIAPNKTIFINILFMRNFIFCLILYSYGSLMAVWFFQRHKIAKSLPLALVTHNPVQIILNIYVISYAIMKYKLPIFDITNLMAVMTLYFPALIWEISRKIRAPKEETEYVTYSKLFGYKKCVK